MRSFIPRGDITSEVLSQFLQYRKKFLLQFQSVFCVVVLKRSFILQFQSVFYVVISKCILCCSFIGSLCCSFKEQLMLQFQSVFYVVVSKCILCCSFKVHFMLQFLSAFHVVVSFKFSKQICDVSLRAAIQFERSFYLDLQFLQ